MCIRDSICALQGVEMKAAIGDFDSVSKTQVIQIQQMAERMEQLPSHKDETDTEEAVLYALAPVSYTHLDVYKRQSVCSRKQSTFNV